jgi:site-specific recombinase XerD
MLTTTLPKIETNLLTLQTALDEFRAIYMPARNYSTRTREEYQSDMKDLAGFLEGRHISTWQAVSLRDLQSFMAELDRRGLEPSSRNRKTYTIKTFFAYLHQAGHTRHNVARELIPPTIPHKERRFLSEEEYQAILAAAHSSRDRAILEVFLQTGLRLCELVNLTLDDLELPKRITKDPENVGFLHIRRKRGKEANLPLNWKVCEALAAWLKERPANNEQRGASDALFVSKFKKALTPRSTRYLVEKYLKRAGITGASVHTLRHTMATHYLAKGGDLKSVQEMLGHESLETTQIYLGLAKKVQRRMVQELAL